MSGHQLTIYPMKVDVAASFSVGWVFAASLDFTGALEFAAGDENAPGKTGYPC